MYRVLIIFGTRPEAIKLAPIIKELKAETDLEVIVCSTGQHREMLKQVWDIFKLQIDIDLDLMQSNQDLFDLTINTVSKLNGLLIKLKPDLVIVQGDTTTAFLSALSAYYLKLNIAHVEAGLRSFSKYSPFPEEANRKFISTISDLNFAPTKDSAQNLLNEGIDKQKIFVTGNSVVDALNEVTNLLEDEIVFRKQLNIINLLINEDLLKKRFILVTLHRREKFGLEFVSLLNTLKKLSFKYHDYNFLYPVHLNPNVSQPVHKVLGGLENFKLIPPQEYLTFLFLMKTCYFILSDSGGVQEECFVFKKPILVMRDVTERNEAIRAGYAFLVGSDPQKIENHFDDVNNNLANNFNYFNSPNPFGEGQASKQIKNHIRNFLLHNVKK